MSRKLDAGGSSPQAVPPTRVGALQASLWLCALGAVAAAAFGQHLDGPFVFDDIAAIRDNESIRGSAIDALSPPRDTSVASRPLVNWTLWVNRAMCGPEAVGYRVVNLGFHVITAWVLALLLAHAFGSPRVPAALQARARQAALGTALVFVVHPLTSEVVYYPTQRTELLAVLLSLACLWLCASAASRQSKWLSVAGIACCWLAMGCKEAAAGLPLIVLGYDRALIAGSFAGALRLRKWTYAGLAASWVYLAWTVLQAGRAKTVGYGLGPGFTDYLATQFEILPTYFLLVVRPWPLSMDYGPLHQTPLLAHPMGAMFVAALVIGSTLAVWRAPRIGLVLGAVCGWLAPSSGLIPIVTEIGAERRMYLPLAALLPLAAALLVVGIARSGTGRTLGAGLACAVVAAAVGLCGWLTHERGRDWVSAQAAWSAAAEARPRNARAHWALGVELQLQGDAPQAELHYRRALELRPYYADANMNLAVLLVGSGRLAEALPHFERAVVADPLNVMKRANYGLALRDAGQLGPARTELEAALQVDPDSPEALRNLGLVELSSNRPEAALRHFEHALRHRSGDVNLRLNRAQSLRMLGRESEARAEIEGVLREQPSHAGARQMLGQ
ncbi:MAG: tetratricopeptide repeat protein [Planctomycetes bacterium]|nr:tetratricopeptide repeat protein [Planctomycetota bacterium]